jgi:hypothetical protein
LDEQEINKESLCKAGIALDTTWIAKGKDIERDPAYGALGGEVARVRRVGSKSRCARKRR